MPAGEPGGSVWLAMRMQINLGGVNLPSPGPTVLINWADAQNAHAAFGSLIHVENTGPNVIDALVVRASYQNNGAFYEQGPGYGPIGVGQSLDIPLPGAVQTCPPPFVYLEATNATPTTCQVRIVNMNG